MSQGAKIFPLVVSTDSIALSPLALILGGFMVIGSGTAPNESMRAMLKFAAIHKVKPQIEKFPMTQAGITDAMQKLRDGKMRYRGVLVRA
jgi:D-arabinose 1-dehydrogenase-like Zn-dependent alcohol dehydrogenase